MRILLNRISNYGFIGFLALLISSYSGFAQFPCKEYVLRQTVDASTTSATTELGIVNRTLIPDSRSVISPLCTYTDAAFNQQYNGLVYYNDRLFAWVQYGANTGTGGEAIVEFKTDCSAPTTTAINTSNNAVINAATVDPNTGIYYGGSGNGSSSSSFIINRVDLSGATPSLLSNLTVTLPSGSTFPGSAIGDLSYVPGPPDKIYFWLNNTGLFSIDVPSTSTTSITATRISSSTNVTRVVGSTYWIVTDPNILYGYGSTSSTGTQDRLLSISLADGAVTELTTNTGSTTSQSDGAGCAIAIFEIVISGNVFIDSDASTGGVDGSPYAAGDLKVNLLNSAGNVIATANVAADGTYKFIGVAPGNYSIQLNTIAGTIGNPPPTQILPTGYVNTGDEIGTTQGSSPNNGISETITVGTDDITNINFGIREQLGTVSGTVWEDNTDNNALDKDAGVSGVVIELQDASGNVIASTTTGSGGTYTFNNVASGDYFIVIGTTPKPLQYDNDDTVDSANDTEENNTGSTTTTTGLNTSDGRIPVSITSSGAETDGSNDFITSNFTNGNAPLPVKLVSFESSETNTGVLLKWKTTSEINNRGFEILHSINAKDFSKIGFVDGINSREASSYEFEHLGAVFGKNYYQLVQLDFDQSTTKSKIIVQNYSNAGSILVSYPNPTYADLYIKGLVAGDHISLSNAKGSVIQVVDFDGTKEVSFSLKNQVSGVYFIKVTRNGLAVHSSKIIKD